MCGLFTVYDEDVDLQKARSALKTLVHRGPDGTAEFTSERHFMGHTRISIIDLTQAAQQPCVSEDKLVSKETDFENSNELILNEFLKNHC